jgi:hypothetical protein
VVVAERWERTLTRTSSFSTVILSRLLPQPLGQGGDNKDEKDKKVGKQDYTNLMVLTFLSTEG